MAGTESSVGSWFSSHSSVLGENIRGNGVTRKGGLTFVPNMIESVIGSRELDLVRAHFGIPTSFRLESPGTGGRIDSPSKVWIDFYEESFRAGFRLFVHPFIIQVFHFFNLSPCSLIPNFFRFIIRFIITYFLANIRPSIPLFRYFFTLRRRTPN